MDHRRAGPDLSAWRLVDGALYLRVRLTPRSSAERVEGFETTADGQRHLKARVRAVPEKGRANAALEALLATHLSLPSGRVRVVAGATARLKSVRVETGPEELERIARLLDDLGA